MKHYQPSVSEFEWKAQLTEDLRGKAALVLSLHGHAMQAPGWPDLYIAHRFWSGWLELKREATLAPLQRERLEGLTSRGVNGWIVHWPFNQDNPLWLIKDSDMIYCAETPIGDINQLLRTLATLDVK